MSSSMTGEVASWKPSWEGCAIYLYKIREALTRDSALTKQCNNYFTSIS